MSSATEQQTPSSLDMSPDAVSLSGNEMSQDIELQEVDTVSLPDLAPAPAEEISHGDVTSLNTVKKPFQSTYQLLNSAHIFVMNGIHEGATFNIKEAIKIGSNVNNDLILTDLSIEDYHVTLEPFETKLDYGIKVTARSNHVTLNAEFSLTAGEEIRLTNNFVLSLGGISLNIRITRAGMWTTAYQKYISPKINVAEAYHIKVKETVTDDSFLRDKKNISLFILSSLLVLFLSVFLWSMRDTSKPPLLTMKKTYITSPVTEQLATQQLTHQALGDLQNVLEKYNLSQRVTLEEHSKTIYATGRITGFENKDWIRVTHWYDNMYGGDINLVSLLEINNGARRTLSFKAVVTKGHMPYVVSWTGDRYKIGSTLPGGWMVMNITTEGVHVKDAVEDRVFIVKHTANRSL